jgi:hypothetical protein
MLISNIAPRHFSPNGVYHVHAYTKLFCHLFSGRPVSNSVSNFFDFVGRQFFCLFKYCQRVSGVAARCNIFQVICAVVGFIAVFMVNMVSFRPWAYKSRSHHTVQRFVKMLSVYRQSHEKIPVTSPRRHQNVSGVFVSGASQNFADNCLAYPEHGGYFTRAHAFRRQAPHLVYVRFIKSALRKIWWPQATHAPFVAYVVYIFKTSYITPHLHMQTPVS